VARTKSGTTFVVRGVQNTGSSHATSGICQDGKSLAFRGKHDSESPKSFARSIALCFHASRKPGVTIPWLPVERMRSTQGRLHGGPEQTRSAPLTNLSRQYQHSPLLGDHGRIPIEPRS
jgi:hypothetical protein